MADDKEKEYKRLRSFLNKAIRGENTDAILRSVATGPVHLVQNVKAVNDSLYIVTAQGKYLDQRLGDRGITRPESVGLDDESFRNIGIEIANRKQVRDLVHQLLRILYGEVYTRATSISQESENFILEDGDNLIISFDGAEPVEIFFSDSQFENISSATAQEVSDAITKSLRKIGSKGSAFVQDDGGDLKVVLISSTDGPSSSIQVLGGKAQNVLKFSEIKPTSNDATTQWTLTQQPSGAIRATWTGGSNPSLGKVQAGDYVNIYGTSFDLANRGTFTVIDVQGGTIGNAYVEFDNPNGIPEIVTQGTAEALLFFDPNILDLTSKERYAAAYQTSSKVLEIFMPATTKVVRRQRAGAAHIYESGPSAEGQYGPYLYDPTKGFTISGETATTTEVLDESSNSIVEVADSTEFPDGEGDLIFGFGTSHEEGPIPYIARPSSQTLRINPAYKFKNIHPVGTDISLVAEKNPPEPSSDGEDFSFYLTDSVAGRIYAEDVIRDITATGIKVIFYILYPSDLGLGKWGDEQNSEKYYVWGEEEDLIG